MYRQRNNNNRRNFYSYKPLNDTPHLPMPEVTRTTDLYPGDTVDGHGNARTAFNKLRDYDITVDKIDLKIAGAATIYGRQNPKQAFVWQSDEVGLYTASLNQQYATDNFRLISTIHRDASINYWGIDFLTTEPEINIKQFRAVRTWINNTQTLVQHIEASQTTDLAINTLSYQPTRLSIWSNIFSPLQYLLIAYQTEVYLILNFIQAFVTLLATLPKFQELYHTHAHYFVHLQNELSRSKFRSRIKSLLTWIKRRWVDKAFYKEVIAPTTVISKKTDGLNSPILYLITTLSIPAEPLACAQAYGNPTYEGSDYDLIQKTFVSEPQRNSDNFITGVAQAQDIGSDNKIISRAMNNWSLDTVLELILRGGDQVQTMTRINQWLELAVSAIDEVSAASIDFIQNNSVLALETALARLSTAPGIGAMNWVQNLEVNPIPPVIQFADWQFTNELVLMNITSPTSNGNGYELSIPMFKNTGIEKQMQLEYFQSFYLASNEHYMSYVNVSDRVKIRFRDYTLIGLVLVRNSNESTYEIRYSQTLNSKGEVVTTGDWTNLIDISPDYASLAFQDKFTQLSFQTSGTRITWVNPNFMCYVKVNYTSRAAEFEIWNTQNYIIPLG